MLAVEMTLLTGNYVATSYNDRSRCEWPPHPSRLFSALVATHFDVDTPDPAERDALEWIEVQPPPAITASNVDGERRDGRDVVTVFVPTNDATTIGSFDKEQDAVAEARAAVDAARNDLADAIARNEQARTLKKLEKAAKAADKDLEKAEERLSKKFEKAIATSIEVSTTDEASARRLFPDTKVRQPRTFPSIAPDTPSVTFTWQSDPPENVRAAIQRLLERVVRVGHSASLVRMRLAREVPEPTYQPDELSPTRLRVPAPGQLARLEDQFALHQETQPRVLPFAASGYRAPTPTDDPAEPQSVFEDDWLVFAMEPPEPRRAIPIVRSADVAEAVRAALLEHAEEPIPEVLSGHAPDGGASQSPHIAILTLPYVGSRYADGRLLGVAIAVPRTASDDDRRALYRAVGRWENAIRRQTNTEEEGPALPLGFGGPAGWHLRRLEEIARLRTLQSGGWCKPSRTWTTATPVALDRNPGDLLSKDPAKEKAAFGAAEASIRTACERIGLPAPARVIVSRGARLVGAEKCRRYPRYPKNPDRNARVLVHATVEFASPVRGPVLLGAGRYVGLGLFKPLGDVAVLPRSAAS